MVGPILATFNFTISLSDYDGGWQVRARLSLGLGSLGLGPGSFMIIQSIS